MERLSVSDVRAYLAPHGLDVRELAEDTSTAVLAAQALGTTVGTIVKSLLFMAGGEPILVLASGDRRVDPGRLARELGVAKARLAKSDEVLAFAGYPVGGVPPVAHRRPLRTVMDRHLMQHPMVFAAAGAPNAIFPVAPSRLRELTGAEMTEAAE